MHLIKMPLGDTPLQYPFPYKTGDGEDQSSVNTLNALILTDTSQATGFFNGTGTLQVHGGTQIWGDLWVAGNVYVGGRIYSTTFQPQIATYSGDITGLTYITRSANFQPSVSNGCAVCSVIMTFDYTGSTALSLYISGLPSVSVGGITQIVPDVVVVGDNLTGPVYGEITASSTELALKNTSTGAALSLIGTGRCTINLSFYYMLTGAALTFTPTLECAAGSLGTITYAAQDGYYGVFGIATIASVRLTGSTTGGSSPTGLRVSGLPSSPLYIQPSGGVNGLWTASMTPPPATLLTKVGTNKADLYNVSTNALVNGTNSGAFGFSTNFVYFDSGNTSFTPVLEAFNGTIGTISYTSQIGQFGGVDLGAVYYIKLEGTYTSASTTLFGISGFPTSCGLIPCPTKQIKSTLPQPLAFTLSEGKTSGLFYNDSLFAYTPLSGSGSFSIIITGVYNSL